MSSLTLDQCIKPPSRGGLAADDVKRRAQALGISIAGKNKAELCTAIMMVGSGANGSKKAVSPLKHKASNNKNSASPTKKLAIANKNKTTGMIASAAPAPYVRRTPLAPISERHRLPFGSGKVARPSPMFRDKSREAVLALAAGIQAGDAAAIAEAKQLAKEYLARKESVTELFKKWAAAGYHSGDEELQIAGEFLSRYCRCLWRIKQPGTAKFGICSKSIFTDHGLVGPSFRGTSAIKCDDDLAKAEIAIEGSLKNGK